MDQQLVIFKLGNECFGIDIASVDGIIKMQNITSIPRAPHYVEGVLNLRGTIVPIIDLHTRFDFPPKTITPNTRIINVMLSKTRVGMIVDEVSEVLTISEENIEAAPPMVTTINSSFITGIAKINEQLVIMLDVEQVLTQEETKQIGTLAIQAKDIIEQ